MSLKRGYAKANQIFFDSIRQPSTLRSRTKSLKWKPGILSQFPWTGFGALGITLIFSIASIVVLVKSNGDLVENWKVQPAVLLAIFTTLSNALIRYAFFQGVTISWWKRAIEGEKLSELHRIWAFGDSVLAAVFAGKHMGLVAFASIMATVVMVENPLLQRASRVEVVSQASSVDIQAHIQPQWDMSSVTCTQGGRTEGVTGLSTLFTSVVKSYSDHTPITAGVTGCAGSCTSEVQGAGFSIDCKASVTDIDNSDVQDEAMQSQESNGVALASDLIFSTRFDDTSLDVTSGNFSMTIVYSSSKSESTDTGPRCPGTRTTKECTVQPAIVTYPITILDNTISLNPAPAGGYSSTPVQFVAYNVQNGNNPLGGFRYAMDMLFGSSGYMSYDGQSTGFSVELTGMTANTYLRESPLGCSANFTDPSADLAQALHELALRFALASANDTAYQTVSAPQVAQVAVFRSYYVYLAVAMVITFLSGLVILLTYNGWWKLGREFSLSPLETAKAFNAPLLQEAHSNSNIGQLNEKLGAQKVKYGEVGFAADGKALHLGDDDQSSGGTRLEIVHAAAAGDLNRQSTFTE